MSTRKTTAEKIEAAKLEKQQAENRIKKLLQEQKAEERRIRTHRLCKRGGQVEKLLPGLARLTEEQFETFVEKTLLTGLAEKVLRGLSPQESEPDAEPEVITDTVQDDGGDAADNTTTARKSNANSNAGASEPARVAS